MSDNLTETNFGCIAKGFSFTFLATHTCGPEAEREMELRIYRRSRRALRSLKWQVRACNFAMRSRLTTSTKRQRRIILCLGDSHARPLSADFSAENRYFVFSVSGATISGLRSLRSETGTLQIFRMALRRARKADGILIGIGEIDVGYLAWVRSSGSNLDARSYLDTVFERFVAFLEQEVLPLRRPVYVVSVSHPTVTSYEIWPDQAFDVSPTLSIDRKRVTADLEARIDLTRLWNVRIQDWCAHNRVNWLDITPESTAPSGHVLHDWNSEHPLDHHLNRYRYRELVDQMLTQAGRVNDN